MIPDINFAVWVLWEEHHHLQEILHVKFDKESQKRHETVMRAIVILPELIQIAIRFNYHSKANPIGSSGRQEVLQYIIEAHQKFIFLYHNLVKLCNWLWYKVSYTNRRTISVAHKIRHVILDTLSGIRFPRFPVFPEDGEWSPISEEDTVEELFGTSWNTASDLPVFLKYYNLFEKELNISLSLLTSCYDAPNGYIEDESIRIRESHKRDESRNLLLYKWRAYSLLRQARDNLDAIQIKMQEMDIDRHFEFSYISSEIRTLWWIMTYLRQYHTAIKKWESKYNVRNKKFDL